MKKYGKLAAGMIVLALLLGGSAILYKSLAEKYRPDALKTVDREAPSENEEEEGNYGEDGTEAAGGQSSGGTGNAGEQSSGGTGNAGGQSGSGAAGGEQDGGEEADESMKAPDFTVQNTAEEEVKLSDFAGKPVIVNFWASWCGPCKSEMPYFQNMYDTYGEDVVFMMVNLTGGRETVDTALDYIQQAEYTFPVYFDTKQEAAYAYYVSSIPATYFIDAEGNLAAYGVGALQEENILQGLELLGIDTE